MMRENVRIENFARFIWAHNDEMMRDISLIAEYCDFPRVALSYLCELYAFTNECATANYRITCAILEHLAECNFSSQSTETIREHLRDGDSPAILVWIAGTQKMAMRIHADPKISIRNVQLAESEIFGASRHLPPSIIARIGKHAHWGARAIYCARFCNCLCEQIRDTMSDAEIRAFSRGIITSHAPGTFHLDSLMSIGNARFWRIFFEEIHDPLWFAADTRTSIEPTATGNITRAIQIARNFPEARETIWAHLTNVSAWFDCDTHCYVIADLAMYGFIDIATKIHIAAYIDSTLLRCAPLFVRRVCMCANYFAIDGNQDALLRAIDDFFDRAPLHLIPRIFIESVCVPNTERFAPARILLQLARANFGSSWAYDIRAELEDPRKPLVLGQFAELRETLREICATHEVRRSLTYDSLALITPHELMSLVSKLEIAETRKPMIIPIA
jgi:hypothetical protein